MDCGLNFRRISKGIREINYRLRTAARDCVRSHKKQIHSLQSRDRHWNSIVTIILVKARNLPTISYRGKLVEAYVKFRLGIEKHCSKISWHERWVEQFSLHVYEEDQFLEMSLWNRNIMYGKTVINLATYPREMTQGIWQRLDDCTIEIFLMITISGTTGYETINDLKTYREDPSLFSALDNKYSWTKTPLSIRDVGHLTVKVFGASGLASADFTGKSDPFCVVELINARLQTQTEYKTIQPNWNKIFTFNVRDITSVLEFTVYDEDRKHKVEILGKLVIPLWKIQNGIKRWYTLKDKELHFRAKGKSPQILLEMTVIWNPVRAVLRCFYPKEEKLIQLEPKFNRRTFLRNVQRFKISIMPIVGFMKYIQSCFEWESPIRSICAFCMWIILCLYGTFELIPCIFLIIIFRNFCILYFGGMTVYERSRFINDFYEHENNNNNNNNNNKQNSIRKRVMAIQDSSQAVQNIIGSLASIVERIQNTFNYSVPSMTWIAALLICISFILLHFVQFRWIMLIWGTIKFVKRFFRPNSVPNNELLDLLSRVPNAEDKINFYDIPPLPTYWVEKNNQIVNNDEIRNTSLLDISRRSDRHSKNMI